MLREYRVPVYNVHIHMHGVSTLSVHMSDFYMSEIKYHIDFVQCDRIFELIVCYCLCMRILICPTHTHCVDRERGASMIKSIRRKETEGQRERECNIEIGK